jgi:hypothetical protein
MDGSAVLEVVNEPNGSTYMPESRLHRDTTDQRGRGMLQRSNARVTQRPPRHGTSKAEHGLNLSSDYDTRHQLWAHAEPAAQHRAPLRRSTIFGSDQPKDVVTARFVQTSRFSNGTAVTRAL